MSLFLTFDVEIIPFYKKAKWKQKKRLLQGGITKNTPTFFGPICLPKRFSIKSGHWVSLCAHYSSWHNLWVGQKRAKNVLA